MTALDPAVFVGVVLIGGLFWGVVVAGGAMIYARLRTESWHEAWAWLKTWNPTDPPRREDAGEEVEGLSDRYTRLREQKAELERAVREAYLALGGDDALNRIESILSAALDNPEPKDVTAAREMGLNAMADQWLINDLVDAIKEAHDIEDLKYTHDVNEALEAIHHRFRGKDVLDEEPADRRPASG